MSPEVSRRFQTYFKDFEERYVIRYNPQDPLRNLQGKSEFFCSRSRGHGAQVDQFRFPIFKMVICTTSNHKHISSCFIICPKKLAFREKYQSSVYLIHGSGQNNSPTVTELMSRRNFPSCGSFQLSLKKCISRNCSCKMFPVVAREVI
jgi:hypothetical protein